MNKKRAALTIFRNSNEEFVGFEIMEFENHFDKQTMPINQTIQVNNGHPMEMHYESDIDTLTCHFAGEKHKGSFEIADNSVFLDSQGKIVEIEVYFAKKNIPSQKT